MSVSLCACVYECESVCFASIFTINRRDHKNNKSYKIVDIKLSLLNIYVNQLQFMKIEQFMISAMF